MSNPPNNFNTNTSFNKYKGSYFNNDIDVSGGNIISRTGNLYLADNSSIYTSTNRIQFDDVYKFTNFIYNVNIYGQQKLTYNSVVYDVGERLEKIASLETKLTNITYTTGTDTTTISDNIIFTGNLNNISSVTYSYLANVTGDIAYSITNLQTQINGINSISLSANNTFTGTNIFNETLRLNNNLRLQGALLVDNGGTTITNATLRNLQYLANVTSDINTSISNLNTKTTNISYGAFNTTTFSGNLSFPTASINSTSISNSTFVALSGNQSVGGQKTFNSQAIFSNNIRLDTGSLILNTNTLTLTNANLQKIQYLSTVSSDIQTQINNISGVSLSAINTFSGAFNTFSNNIRLDGSLLLNAGGLTLTNANLQKLQYCSTISSDIQTQTNTLLDKTSSLTYDPGYGKTTISSLLETTTLTFSNTLNSISTTTFGYLSGLSANIQDQLNSLGNQITALTNRQLPTGAVIPSPVSTLELTSNYQYLLCNGQQVSRTTYSGLFITIGTTFGAGNGSTTFTLPNYQGLFFRGMGSQTINGTVYTGVSVNNAQQDSLENHNHEPQSGAYLGTITSASNSGGYISSAGLQRPNQYSFGDPGDVKNAKNNDFETRPVNVGMYYYIKT